MVAESEKGQKGNSSLEKRPVRKALALFNPRPLNVTQWRCSYGITHEGLGGRPGAAARGRGAEHAAWARQAPLLGGWGTRPAPPPLQPGGRPQGRGREVRAQRRGTGGEGSGAAGPNHMAQTAQAARHLFLSLSRASAPIPPHHRPLPGPGPKRIEASSAQRRNSLFA